MLSLQSSCSEVGVGQGCLALTLDELQAGPAVPGASSEAHRQRLLTLADRLARVHAMGGRYARVDFSPVVKAQLRHIAS